MKKMLVAAAIVCAAVCAHAAAVGWSVAGGASVANNAYQFYVIGQNGVTDIATVTALLDAGASTADYVFGSGKLNGSGTGTQVASTSGKTLAGGTYQSFAVIFDSANPTAGASKYVLVSGLSNLTKTFADTAASVTFATGAAGSIVGDASNWKSFGSAGPIAPEPTSGLLLLIGMAGLALKRKVA